MQNSQIHDGNAQENIVKERKQNTLPDIDFHETPDTTYDIYKTIFKKTMNIFMLSFYIYNLFINSLKINGKNILLFLFTPQTLMQEQANDISVHCAIVDR